MANVSVLNMEGNKVGEINLSDDIFGVKINNHLVYMAIKLQLANKRQGTQKTKTRGEVRGGGRKPWKQKGTGHARQGSIRAPQWVGGGCAFAKVPRDYSLKMNKKEKKSALRSVLTSKFNDNKLIILDELKFNAIKTKEFVKVVKNLKINKSLFVTDNYDSNVILSSRNISNVKIASPSTINVFDILKYDKLIITKSAVSKIEEVYA